MQTEHDYHDALEFHHKVMILAMKSKQTVDPAAAAALGEAIEDLSKVSYRGSIRSSFHG